MKKVTPSTDHLGIFIENVRSGDIKLPDAVIINGKETDPVRYQLVMVRYELSIAIGGLKPYKGWTMKNIKAVFQINGRTAKDVLEQFNEKIYNPYLKLQQSYGKN